MKVAMVSEHASPLAAVGGVDAGGQNVHVAALSAALVAEGHEVVVYTRRDDPSLPRRVTMDSGVAVEHVDAGPAAPLPKDDIYPYVGRLAGRLRRRWAADRPDLVHAHFWMSGVAALDAARAWPIPVVQTFHALGTVKRRHQGTYDTSPPERLAREAELGRRMSRIIATCTDELAELTRMGVPRERVSVVPCGVDTDQFSPSGPSWPRAGHRPRIAVIGRLVERKGIDDTIRALTQIPDAELVVAGGPDRSGLEADADARRLTRLARTCGVGDRVRLTGRLDRPGVAALVRSSDLVVCVPWYEPFGIVPLEAMSCAVAVVASDVGGLSDTVVHGSTGLHVAPRRPDALARTIADLLADPQRRARFGAAGRLRALERYKWSQVAEATVAAYESAGSSEAEYGVAR